MKTYLLSLLVLCSAIASTLTAQTTINYTADPSDFPNPERGFFRYSETRSGNYTLLDQSTIEAYRTPHQPSDANYTIQSTLVWRYFFLEDFVNSPISTDYLSKIQQDLNTIRNAGAKLIVRFAYTDEYKTTGCTDDPCAPYGDADKATILQHITQLQPLFQANKDVIVAVQMGFIGIWGENYYTDHFGYPAPYNNTNWQDRIDVLNALLTALPKERMLMVRYPHFKQTAMYGIGTHSDDNPAPLTLAEAHSETDKARIGYHNDCFLASYTDFGTYTDYTRSFDDSTNLKPYKAADSRFVVVGGETCAPNAPADNCASDNGRADQELERMHYSFLNSQYNNSAVNNGWGSCIEAIKRRLGYRFVLQSGTYPNTAQAGQNMTISIALKNEGYAAPFNPRSLELLLRNTTTQELFVAALPDDPRFWLPKATHTISSTICLPACIPAGTYSVLLNLPDPEPLLYNNPDYSMRLANTGVWEASTGFNQLQHNITISTGTSNCTLYEPSTAAFAKADAIQIAPKIFLQGAYETATNRMNDQLRSTNLLSLTEPYTDLGFTQIHSGGETISADLLNTTGDNAIVDWVLVELRAKNDATEIRATRAALLQRDGDIVDVDGVSPVQFPCTEADDYFVAIRHRNHLSVMTQNAVPISN